jgi:hypothetical protein
MLGVSLKKEKKNTCIVERFGFGFGFRSVENAMSKSTDLFDHCSCKVEGVVSLGLAIIERTKRRRQKELMFCR